MNSIQPPVKDVVKSYGRMTVTETSILHSALTAITTTIPVVHAVMHYCMRTTHIILTAMITALTVIMSEVDRNRSIHDYGYKPEPIFYGDSKRYFGVELEIDGAGKDSDNADELLSIANKDEEHIYIKGDGSLDDGMELVTYPMSLDCHKDFQWDEIMKKAIYLGYRSHQTSTCGLHVHVNRDCLGV